MSKFSYKELARELVNELFTPPGRKMAVSPKEQSLQLPQGFFEDDSYGAQEGSMRISFGFTQADIKDPKRKEWLDRKIRKLGFVEFGIEKKNYVVKQLLRKLEEMTYNGALTHKLILGGTINITDIDAKTCRIVISVIPAFRPMNNAAKERYRVGDAKIVKMPLFVDDPDSISSWQLPVGRDGGNLYYGLDGLRINLEVFFWSKRIAYLQQ